MHSLSLHRRCVLVTQLHRWTLSLLLWGSGFFGDKGVSHSVETCARAAELA